MRYRTLETQLQTFLYWGQFCTYLKFRGEKYLNTFIVTNANNCPNPLSHGTTFRMGVLLPNYSEKNVVKEESVPNFKINTSKDASSNVFQILQDLRLNSMKDSTILVLYQVPHQNSTRDSTIRVPHLVPYQNSMKYSTILVPY